MYLYIQNACVYTHVKAILYMSAVQRYIVNYFDHYNDTAETMSEREMRTDNIIIYGFLGANVLFDVD